jgi:outer membrane murein-binding lipoprotein Lpp
MKNLKKLLVVGVTALILTGCSSVSEADYNNVQTDYAELEAKYEKLESDYSALNTRYNQLSSDYDALQADYDELVAENEPVEDSDTDAQIDVNIPEDLADYRTDITYDNLARTPDDYFGEAFTMSGTVIQVLENDDEIDLRVAINDDYDKVIFIGYEPDIVSERILEDDKIVFYGISAGLYTYESTLGGNITIPSAYVTAIERK